MTIKKTLKETTEELLGQSKEATGKLLNDAKKTAKNATKKAAKVAEATSETIVKASKEKAKKGKETLTNVSKETAAKAAKAVSNTASKASEVLHESAEKATETIKESAKKASNKIVKNLDKSLHTDIVIEYAGKQITEEMLTEKFKDLWLADHSLEEVKTLKVYFNVDQQTAYFVVNEKDTLKTTI